MVGGATFSNVTFDNVTFDDVIIRDGSQFVDNCAFHRCTFNNSKLVRLTWNELTLDSLRILSSSICDLRGQDVHLTSPMIVYNTSINRNYFNMTSITNSSEIFIEDGANTTCNVDQLNSVIECRKPDSFGLYRDSFFVSASALPGNIASAIAVYFLRRNYWLGE